MVAKEAWLENCHDYTTMTEEEGKGGDRVRGKGAGYLVEWVKLKLLVRLTV